LQQGSLPTGCFNVFLFLLPKKLGGFRTIGMFPTFYRILMKLLSPEFREWDSRNANSNDTAKKGSESEYALYKRQTMIENAKHEGLIPSPHTLASSLCVYVISYGRGELSGSRRGCSPQARPNLRERVLATRAPSCELLFYHALIWLKLFRANGNY
jgi:hypothetical protein